MKAAAGFAGAGRNSPGGVRRPEPGLDGRAADKRIEQHPARRKRRLIGGGGSCRAGPGLGTRISRCPLAFMALTRPASPSGRPGWPPGCKARWRCTRGCWPAGFQHDCPTAAVVTSGPSPPPPRRPPSASPSTAAFEHALDVVGLALAFSGNRPRGAPRRRDEGAVHADRQPGAAA